MVYIDGIIRREVKNSSVALLGSRRRTRAISVKLIRIYAIVNSYFYLRIRALHIGYFYAASMIHIDLDAAFRMLYTLSISRKIGLRRSARAGRNVIARHHGNNIV